MTTLWNIMRTLVPKIDTPTASEKLLYIEPRLAPSPRPLVDELTRKMVMALRNHIRTGVKYMGWHECSCGAHSTNTDYLLPGGWWTNSLCVHYLAYHRTEVPASALATVASFPGSADCIPTQEELEGIRMAVLKW
jgi:hypothetical protein